MKLFSAQQGVRFLFVCLFVCVFFFQKNFHAPDIQWCAPKIVLKYICFKDFSEHEFIETIKKLRASQMGHFVTVSLRCASISLSTNTRFRFLYFRMNNFEAYKMLHQEKELPNDPGRPLSYNNFTDKKNGYY